MNDSQHFLLEHFEAIHDSPSQIYHSALPFSPSSSWLCTYDGVELSQEVRIVKGLQAEWGVCFRTVTLGDSPFTLACWKDIIAVGCYAGDIIFLNGITGSQIAILSGHSSIVKCLAFSSDGTSLVSGSYDKTVKLWDVQTGGVVKTFHGHTHNVCSVSISADSTMIASGSDDKTICLWNTQTEECCHVLKQQDPVFFVRFSPTDSQGLISASGGKLWQWCISGHQVIPAHDGPQIPLSLGQVQLVLCQGVATVVQHLDKRQLYNCCCPFPGGELIAIAVGSAINIWDITGSDPHLVKSFVGHTNEISSIAFSSPSSLISSTYRGPVKFWQIGDLLVDPVVTDSKSTHPAPAPINSITLQAKDGIVISSDSNGVVSIWDVSTGLHKESFQTPAKDCRVAASWLVDGRLTFAWVERNPSHPMEEQVHVWDVERGEFQLMNIGYRGCTDLKISGDGSRVFCLQMNCIQAWFVPTGAVVGIVNTVYHPASKLSVDGLRVWVHSADAEPQGWDFGIPGSSPVQMYNIPPLHPNNNKLWDVNQSRIKDAANGEVIFQLGGRFVNPVSSQWDGWYLVAGYGFGEVLILDFNHVHL